MVPGIKYSTSVMSPKSDLTDCDEDTFVISHVTNQFCTQPNNMSQQLPVTDLPPLVGTTCRGIIVMGQVRLGRSCG